MPATLRSALLVAALVAAAAPPLAARAASPCARLAVKARGVPAAAWAHGSKALAPWLGIQDGADPKPGLEKQLAQDPVVGKAAGDEDGERAVFVERLPGTDVYAAYTSQGTLHCQITAFVRARPGEPARLIQGPPGASGHADDGLCWTRSGDFGRVFGRPAYIEHGANSQTTEDEDVRITPWIQGRWSAACTLKLRFEPALKLAERHCRDTAACADLDGKIVTLAAAYERHRNGLHADKPFDYATGAVPDAVRAAAAARRESTSSPEWPGFGPRADDRAVSYNGLAYVPVDVDGRDYVVAIGHEGVGWREGPTALVVAYRIVKGKLEPQAAYAIERGVGGLASAAAD